MQSNIEDYVQENYIQTNLIFLTVISIRR